MPIFSCCFVPCSVLEEPSRAWERALSRGRQAQVVVQQQAATTRYSPDEPIVEAGNPARPHGSSGEDLMVFVARVFSLKSSQGKREIATEPFSNIVFLQVILCAKMAIWMLKL